MATAFGEALGALLKDESYRDAVAANPAKLGEDHPDLTEKEISLMVDVWRSLDQDAPEFDELAAAVYCCCCCCAHIH